MKRRKEFLELIERNTGSNDQDIVSTLFFEYQEYVVYEILKNKIANCRLDLHGVADLLKYDYVIPIQPACIISHSGKNSKTRDIAHDEIIRRVKSKQIDFGVLVFKRAKNNRTIVEPGSKAWVNEAISTSLPVSYFIDDNIEHIKSTNLLKIPNLESIHFQHEKNKLIQLIENTFYKFKNKLC